MEKITLYWDGWICPKCDRIIKADKSFYDNKCGDTVRCAWCRNYSLLYTMTLDKINRIEEKMEI